MGVPEGLDAGAAAWRIQHRMRSFPLLFAFAAGSRHHWAKHALLVSFASMQRRSPSELARCADANAKWTTGARHHVYALPAARSARARGLLRLAVVLQPIRLSPNAALERRALLTQELPNSAWQRARLGGHPSASAVSLGGARSRCAVGPAESDARAGRAENSKTRRPEVRGRRRPWRASPCGLVPPPGTRAPAKARRTSRFALEDPAASLVAAAERVLALAEPLPEPSRASTKNSPPYQHAGHQQRRWRQRNDDPQV